MENLKIYIVAIFLLLGVNLMSQEIIMSTVDQSVCTGVYKDAGGDNDYPGAQNMEQTLSSATAGQEISVHFTMFNLENNFDLLEIWNGPAGAGIPMGTFTGLELLGQTITSFGGAQSLTFIFTSDWVGSQPGWEADISCVFPCQDFGANTLVDGLAFPAVLDICVEDQINVEAIGDYFNNNGDYIQADATSTFTWDFGNNQVFTGANASCTYTYVGAFTITLTIEDVNGCFYTQTQDINVTCGNGCPDCTDFVPTDPDQTTCAGTFWDSGMGVDTYQNDENETITFCSDNGGKVRLQFSEFDLDQFNNDHLVIYDGPDALSPVIGNYTNDNPPPSLVVATGACLTVKFTSSAWSTPGNGWEADISCSHPCQEIDLNLITDPIADSEGVIRTCPGGSVDFTAILAFLENNTFYEQTMANTSISWSSYNGGSGSGTTFNLPADSSFSTEVMIEIIDMNGCHFYDTLAVVSECQAIDVTINTDAAVIQNGEIFISDLTTPLSLDGGYEFPENGSCYTQTLGELTWTFGLSETGSGTVIESHIEDTVITYDTQGVYEVILIVEDQQGCSNQTSVEVHVGCQPVDVSWTGTPTMLGDTIIVCPGEPFEVEITTDYFANDEIYNQDDATSVFNWNLADNTLINNQMNPGPHTYTEAGLYHIFVQIIDQNGCADATYIPVYAFMAPSLVGTAMSIDTVCYGDSLILFGNTTLDMPSYNAPPIFLPDGSGVSYTSTLTFDMFGDEILTDVNDFIGICMTLEHSYTGDLRLELECPSGDIVELLPYTNGCGGHHLGEPCDLGGTSTIGTGYEYCFTPQAASTIPDNINLNNHTFTDNDGNSVTNDYFPAGDYAPTGTFNDLLGCELNGDWILHITDNLLSDDGMIFDWNITLNLEGLIPPDTTQLPLDMREWTVETGNGAIINMFDGDDAYATPLDTGLYTFTFTVTSPAGCAYDTTVGPLYVAPMPQWTLGADTFLCADYNFTIPGSLSDGDGTWSAVGPGTAVFGQPHDIPTTVTVDAYGDYVFYFTPNTIALCADPDSILVSFHELPIVDVLIDSTLCYGSCDGMITAVPLGVELPYKFLWQNSDTTITSDTLCAGDFNLTVTTDYCTNYYSYDIPQPTDLVIIDSGKVDNLCFDDNDGTVWVSVEGGTPGYQYSWFPANNNDSTISGLPDGQYLVTVTDHNGCFKTASQTVIGPAYPLTIESIVPTNIKCFGEQNGILDITAAGGTTPYSYSWLFGDATTGTTEDPTGLGAATHYVTVTDANNCVISGNQFITEPTQLVVNSFDVATTCFGYSDGRAWVETYQGTPGYSYQWSHNSAWADSVIVDQPAGFYTVTVTDGNDCEIIKTIEIIQPTEVIVSIVPTETICIGESLDLIMSVTSSPYSPYKYYWNGIQYPSGTINVSPNVTTDYHAKVVDDHGCFSLIKTETVNVFDVVSATTTLDKLEVCEGDLVLVNVDALGGNGNFTYTMGDGSIVSDSFTIQAEQTHDYEITISDNCGSPTITNAFSINVWNSYLPSFHANKKNGCSALKINFYQDVQNHEIGTSYLWEFGDDTINSLSFDPAPTHTFNTEGSYNVSLEITTPKGCKSEKIEMNYIKVFPVPTADFEASPNTKSVIDPNIFFQNQSVGATMWHWHFGDGDSTFAYSPEHTFPNYKNQYEVTLEAITQYGCIDKFSSTVYIEDEVTFFVPTGFSPDGDGVNDVFKAFGNAIVSQDYSMQIYNRWGERVFESNDINIGWGGKIHDKNIGALGIYSYVIRFVDTFGVPHERSGYVTLLK